MRILLLDKDEAAARIIYKGLCELGHNIDFIHDDKEGLFLASTEDYDVILVDCDSSAFSCEAILSVNRSPDRMKTVIFKGTDVPVEDRISMLKKGAYDYLPKPLAFEELAVKIEASNAKAYGMQQSQTRYICCDLELDLLSRRARRGKKVIELKTQEYRLLEYMLRHKGQVVTRTMLLENVWDYYFDPQSNVIDVHISRLRQKIDNGFELQLIRTIRGAGYMIHDGEEQWKRQHDNTHDFASVGFQQ